MLKPGDVVFLNPKSRWYGFSVNNPTNVAGVVVHDSELPEKYRPVEGITVKWYNGYYGFCFEEKDLILSPLGKTLVLQDSKNSRIVTTNSI